MPVAVKDLQDNRYTAYLSIEEHAGKSTLKSDKQVTAPTCLKEEKPLICTKKSQTIESLLPDEEDLFSFDELGFSATAICDDEDVDLFSSSGGMELEENTSKLYFNQQNVGIGKGLINSKESSSEYLISCENPSFHHHHQSAPVSHEGFVYNNDVITYDSLNLSSIHMLGSYGPPIFNGHHHQHHHAWSFSNPFQNHHLNPVTWSHSVSYDNNHAHSFPNLHGLSETLPPVFMGSPPPPPPPPASNKISHIKSHERETETPLPFSLSRRRGRTRRSSHSHGSRHETVSCHTDDKKYELDIDRVLRGEDGRTTLMIKNIPNKYSSVMLLAAIDEHNQGTYDFIYLPLDFKNKCNMGYAFINMIDPLQIVQFHKWFHGKKWEKFHSGKVACLAYGRIQGKAALIAHFQESSLMNEDKCCHPILFTTDGPNAGNQEPFPLGPNIHSRRHKNRCNVNENSSTSCQINNSIDSVERNP
ncbi:hypothetical protein LXL04_009287 [Taraxacum kok-saghyz]